MSAPKPAPRLALETTLLAHGVPRDAARPLFAELERLVRDRGAEPTTIGVLRGAPIVGLSSSQFDEFLAEPRIEKANIANLGALMHQRSTAATTVSATIELADAAGIRVMATGGIGGVHRGGSLDISADLVALTRCPVAVVCSGCKTILDVEATREALETLGVPVVGYQTDNFPAFYLRESTSAVDARFDDAAELGAFLGAELARTGRGVVVAQSVPQEDAVDPADWARWLGEAERRVSSEGVSGRDVTPRLLSALHEASRGATLRANLALVKANAHLGAQLAVALASTID